MLYYSLIPSSASSRVTIAAGFNHTCAIIDNSTFKCWGSNDQGKLGIGNTNNMGDGAGEMAQLTGIDL